MLKYDQAEGLRRMLDMPKLRVLTFLSALPDSERNGMLINLAATFAQQGKKILLVDAKPSSSSLSAWLNLNADQSLLEVARQQRTMDAVIKEVSPGLSITRITQGANHSAARQSMGNRELAKVFDLAASRSDLVVVDCNLNSDDTFLISSFEESELIIQVSANPETITQAYSLIKRLNNKLGRRTYGIVVSGVDTDQAQRVFANLSMTARRYLAVELQLVGYVPIDVHLTRATELGRAVIDAFPFSKASNAFVRMAEKIVSKASQGLRFETVSH
ncbi:MinD/ParA family ATP-binding protein [Undibacterium fentianense]|uniref:AAA family ATPase n=1 Tax=Undibacterium fentianense TaxID=2828728 RepID=A0A941IF85_9BURK|nr:AAA family ATPase [Undibacterium fentianense]MBR7798795.1 AAA family ATPase [Undibacterium fentianense]